MSMKRRDPIDPTKWDDISGGETGRSLISVVLVKSDGSDCEYSSWLNNLVQNLLFFSNISSGGEYLSTRHQQLYIFFAEISYS